MSFKMGIVVLVLMLISIGQCRAAEDQNSGGAKAGEAARELKYAASESLSTGAMKAEGLPGK